ncbi:MAG TPA: hypothetical protein VK400_06575, partial [Pyrinomonadaceae bacterium]|nr:hypothetical protein [Pyrinomonadaceae bacterium]
MKHCPRCQSTYTDDTLQFCLQDGSVLLNASPVAEAPTVAADTAGWKETEAPTVVRPTQAQRQPVNTGQNQFPPTAAPVGYTETEKSRTGLVVVLTALATLLLVGGGFGAWYLLRNRDAAEVAANSKANNSPPPSNRNSSNANTNKGNA